MVMPAAWYVLVFMESYRLERMLAFLDPWNTHSSAGYHQQSLAIADGGWYGVGLGQGMSKNSFLPECHTDFIYAVIAEVACLAPAVALAFFVLILPAVVSLGGQLIAMVAWLPLARLFCWGCRLLAICSLVTGALPTKGLTLPFISYGSSVFVSLVLIGLLTLWRKAPQQVSATATKRRLGASVGHDRTAATAGSATATTGFAVVDRRWGHRRHIVPGLSLAQQARQSVVGKLQAAWIGWVGDPERLESQMVPRAGLPLFGAALAVRVCGNRDGGSKPRVALSVLAVARPAAATRGCRLGRLPGFATGVAGGVFEPVVLLESNALPGKTNRLLGRLAQVAVVHFPDARRFSHIAGVLQAVTHCRSISFKPQAVTKPLTLVVMGGSLSAAMVNEAAYAG